jgi:hypothetical protein
LPNLLLEQLLNLNPGEGPQNFSQCENLLQHPEENQAEARVEVGRDVFLLQTALGKGGQILKLFLLCSLTLEAATWSDTLVICSNIASAPHAS